MKILAVDIGTGTQDVFLYDSNLDIENNLKLILPSPTMMVFKKIRSATKTRQAILLTGYIMGGGPSQWAAEDHIKSGLPVFATPSAAKSFNDDLSEIMDMGITIISEDEAVSIKNRTGYTNIELKDFNFEALTTAFDIFGVSLHLLDAVAVAVFDHGNSPPGYSDRQFRFDYLDDRIRANNTLSAFAYLKADIPNIMTRLRSVAESAYNLAAPLILMDTAPAAILGASFDPHIYNTFPVLITNIGNFHTLAFRLSSNGIDGVFEHHTGLIDLPKLDRLIARLADGSIRHEEVFLDHGHGALMYQPYPVDLSDKPHRVVVTGPRRSLMKNSVHRPYFASPVGDMMITGCIGLLAATATLIPDFHDQIQHSLIGANNLGAPPWEIPI